MDNDGGANAPGSIDPPTTFEGQVTLTNQANRRFYAPVVLLVALNRANARRVSSQRSDLPMAVDLDDEERVFHHFVSRLGQICDSRKGGFTVTSFAVLQQPDKIEYVFASNRRSKTELETVAGYISSILSMLSSCTIQSPERNQEYKKTLLREILKFNFDRVKQYAKGIKLALQGCIEWCKKIASTEATSQSELLAKLLECATSVTEKGIDDDEVLDRIDDLTVLFRETFEAQSTELFIRRILNGSNTEDTGPWWELRHHSGRILAYSRAVHDLWYAGNVWPQLFKDFKVTPIPSSQRVQNPLTAPTLGASGILGRLIPAELLDRYKELSSKIEQMYPLDKEIAKEWERKATRPIVHAEILVLNWLENSGGTAGARFFHNWQYIGSSKPTCKLCHCYFTYHPSAVKVRGTHGNLYPSWRFPDRTDVHDVQTSEAALRERHNILQEMVGELRRDIQAALSDRLSSTKIHDSSAISSLGMNRPPLAFLSTTREESSPRSLSGVEEENHTASDGNDDSYSAVEVGEVGDDEGGDEGGSALWAKD